MSTTTTSPSLFLSTRSAAPVDFALWAIAAAMAFSMVLIVAAAQRLHWLG